MRPGSSALVSTGDPDRSVGRGGRGRGDSTTGDREGFVEPSSSLIESAGGSTHSDIGGRAGDAFADTAGEGVLEPDFLLRRPIFGGGDFSFSQRFYQSLHEG